MDIRMKVLVSRAMALLLAATLTAACSKVPGVYVYEKDGQASAAKAGATDPKTFVADNWSAKIVPTVHDKAVDVTTVAAAVAKNPEAAGKQYGHQAGTGSPYAYMVKGSGTVTDVDTSVPTGPMTVEVPQAGGKPLKVTVATGPVIAGTAIRDAVGFISFGDFTNQIDYAEAANQINAKVKTDVLAKVDLASIKGRKVEFHGAFSALAPGTIFLVPTELTVAP
jgi:predicted lipoprotein